MKSTYGILKDTYGLVTGIWASEGYRWVFKSIGLFNYLENIFTYIFQVNQYLVLGAEVGHHLGLEVVVVGDEFCYVLPRVFPICHKPNVKILPYIF